MFIKYGDEKSFEISKDKELDVRKEFARQRKFLEQSITSLKKRVNGYTLKNSSYGKLMEKNMILITEINKLRQELKINRKKYDDLETDFKINKSKRRITSKKYKTINLQKPMTKENTLEKLYKD